VQVWLKVNLSLLQSDLIKQIEQLVENLFLGSLMRETRERTM
jgi:hypothetical protein